MILQMHKYGLSKEASKHANSDYRCSESSISYSSVEATDSYYLFSFYPLIQFLYL